MQPAEIELRHYSHADARALRDLLIDVHADAYEEAMDDEFNQRFPWFVDHWSRNPGWSCVVAYSGDTAVGFAYGAPGTPGREWWRECLTPAPPRTATFSVSELMVRRAWRKRGISARLHYALLAGRPEDLAVLLVDTTHPRVEALYESWGYRRVGERRPFPDSPLYAVMLIDLDPSAKAS